MNNLFYTDRSIARRYDLKGSLVGRKSTEQERKDASVALKDQDIDLLADRMSFDEKTMKLVADEMSKDVEFLARCEIMDYSLLLGISELSEEEMQQPIEETPNEHPLYRHLGGVQSKDLETGKPGKYIYYLGIIDILIHYNARKAAETTIKGFSHDKTQISAVPPDFYAKRFKNFMFDHMDGMESEVANMKALE